MKVEIDDEASLMSQDELRKSIYSMTRWEKKFSKLSGKTRFKVKRTFGGIKRWVFGGVARYRGIAKIHTQKSDESNLIQFKPKSRDNCVQLWNLREQ